MTDRYIRGSAAFIHSNCDGWKMLYTIILPSFFLEDKHYAEGLSVTIDEYVVNLLIVRMHKGRMCHCLVYHSSTHESHLDVLRNMFHKMASNRKPHIPARAQKWTTQNREHIRKQDTTMTISRPPHQTLPPPQTHILHAPH